MQRKVGKHERRKARIELVQAHAGRQALEQNRHKIDPKRLHHVETAATRRFDTAKKRCKRLGVSTDIPMYV